MSLVTRRRGLSVRAKLTLSYAGFLTLAGALLLAVVYLFLLRYVPEGQISTSGGHVPNRSDLERAFEPRAALVLLFLMLLGLVGGWFLAGLMLAPLNRINEVVRRVSEGSLSDRAQLPGARDEFRDLADGFDAMLDRLERQVEEQRRFAANASHELRTPLAISQTMLEVARADPARDVDVLVDRLQDLNKRAVALTEALLLLARADGGAFEVEPVDLSLLADQAVETLQSLAEQHGVEVSVIGGQACTSGSPALLQQLAVNLVHNAIVHNLPSGGTVIVRTYADAARAALIVENSGEVIEPALAATLIEPFQRGAQRVRTAGHSGTGLGLAIAQGIVRAHSGTLILTPRPGGGLVAAVRLPAAS